MNTSTLTYSISNERLIGKVGNTSFNIRAASGGRRGREFDKIPLQGLGTWNPSLKLPSINDPVGKSSPQAMAKNNPRDAKVIQNLLNLNGHNLIIDGIVGANTLRAIAGFQKSLGFANPDGRVDPKGATLRGLLRPVAGGPIPPGRYSLEYLENHKTFRECIFLKPILVEESIPGITEWKKRNGFFIHGRGDRGSDGCIVPYTPQDRTKLNTAVASAPGTVELRVKDPYVPPSEFNRIVRATLTA